jgi:hypothetical protein
MNGTAIYSGRDWLGLVRTKATKSAVLYEAILPSGVSCGFFNTASAAADALGEHYHAASVAMGDERTE